MPKVYPLVQDHLQALLHSYSQIVFAKDAWVGAVLLAVSFVHPTVGLCGLLCCLTTHGLVDLLLKGRASLREGVLGFGPLLTGMFIGHTYQLGGQTLLLVVLAAMLCLVATVGLQALLGKLRLPFLTLPFIITVWVVYVFSLSLPNLEAEAGHVYPLLAKPVALIARLDAWALGLVSNVYVRTFFLTLSGIFFNGSLVAGMVVFIATISYSRLCALMMVLGYTGGFLMYALFGLPTTQLMVNLAGANYIFSAIALGGFYLVGNIGSLVAIVLMLPILTALVFFFNYTLGFVGLSSFTLGFVVTTQAFLYFVLNQTQFDRLVPVAVQHNQHEANLYSYLNVRSRFQLENTLRLLLPFMGEWWVSQDYDGKQTHLGPWRYALDFVIADEDNQTWFRSGTQLDDYYCWQKPVLAPADGYVVNAIDQIRDNPIGQVNLENNWGNSLVIQHAPGLYSQLSHLKSGSLKVGIGHYVTRGQVLALCGNSGRSAEPHLHFQLQATPEIGAPTLPYPIASFVTSHGELCRFAVPQWQERVANPVLQPLLTKAFTLLPGTKWKVTCNDTAHIWEVYTDAWNKTYFYSHTDGSIMYFVNDGTFFQATSFTGDAASPLRVLFMATQQVFQGYQPGLALQARLPINFAGPKLLHWLQDLLAPVAVFNQAKYTLTYPLGSALHGLTSLSLTATVETGSGTPLARKTAYSLQFDQNKLASIEVVQSRKPNQLLTCEVL